MRRCPGGSDRCAGRFRKSVLLLAVTTAWGLASSGRPADAAALDRQDPEVLTTEQGSSHRLARQEALEAMSRVRLPQAQAELVRDCVRSTTLYRRLPTQEFDCHPDLLAFALEHPEGVVDIWRVLEISRLTLNPAGPEQWRMADGYGTVGTMRILHRSGDAKQGTLLVHGRGGYSGPFSPKPLTGSCVVLLRYHYVDSTPGSQARVCLKTDAFLDMDGLGLELVTRTLHPLIVTTAGWNVHEICLFMGHLSRTACENPRGVERLSERLTHIAPEHRTQLALAARRAGGKEGDADTEPDIANRLASRWMSNDQQTAPAGTTQ
jgi:hypothetical protein